MSDNNLDQLIASLKTEGIEAAEKAAKKIIDAAEMKAKEIQRDAEKQREQIITGAQQEAEAIVAKGKIVLQQAARDLTLSVQHNLMQVFQSTLEKEVRKGFSPDLIQSVINSVTANIGNDVEINLPKETLMELTDYIHDKVQKNGDEITFNADESLGDTIRISKSQEGWSYHLSPETIATALHPFLTRNWLELLKVEE